MTEYLNYQYKTGQISYKTFWNKTKAKYSFTESVEELNKLWLSGFKPIKGIENLVQDLYKADYELLYLSNKLKERVEYLNNKYNFLVYFKGGIFSYKSKSRKPDKKLYSDVLELTDSEACECVYIDDKEEMLIPASSLGMLTIHFTETQSLIQSLKGFGIRI